MLDNLKNLYNLQKQAKALQKQLEAEKINAISTDGLISITLNGSHELINFKVNSQIANISNDQLEKSFMEAYNIAQNELKNVLAQKFQGLL